MLGWRKSVKLVRGVRLTLSRRGASVSARVEALDAFLRRAEGTNGS